jgi:hypothetical protein
MVITLHICDQDIDLLSVNHKKTKEKGKNNVGQPWNQHDGPGTSMMAPEPG